MDLSTAEERRSQGEDAHRATVQDVALLADLCAQYRLQVERVRGGIELIDEFNLTALDEALLERLVDDPATLVVVGTYEDAPVGIAIVQIVESKPGRRRAVTRTLFVEDPARRVGVGEALLSLCLTWSLDQNVIGFDVPTLPGDRETKSFLEGQGFRARLLTMHRDIAG